MKHRLYKTGDKDAPESIKDQNGEVVLDLCKVCGKGEAELREDCLSIREQALKWWNRLHFRQKANYSVTYDNVWDRLSEEEIEEIWRKETQESISDENMQMLTDEAKLEMEECSDIFAIDRVVRFQKKYKPIKDSWSREEVEQILVNYSNDLLNQKYRGNTSEVINQWIKNNL